MRKSFRELAVPALLLGDARVLMALVLMSACSEAPPTDKAQHELPSEGLLRATLSSGVIGGTRLRPVFIESASGATVLESFHDLELDLDCNFVETTPGTYHCLPRGPGVPSISLVPVYGEPTCSEPLVTVKVQEGAVGACASPNYVFDPGTCETAPRVLKVLGPAENTSSYIKADTRCVRYESAKGGRLHAYKAAEVPLETFVSGQAVVGDETAGLRFIKLRSADGAEMPKGYQDVQEGFDCWLTALLGDYRCAPRSGVIGSWFADAKCEQPAAVEYFCDKRYGQLAFARTFPKIKYFRIGPPLATTFSKGDIACVESGSTGMKAFSVGEPIPMERFATGSRVKGTASDGLGYSFDHLGGRAVLPAHTLTSQQLDGHECEFAEGSDGQLRCLPDLAWQAPEIFADAKCTQAVESGPSELVLTVPGTCPPRRRVLARGDRHPGAVYSIVNDVCILTHESPPGESLRTPHYVYRTEIAPETFVRVARVVR